MIRNLPRRYVFPLTLTCALCKTKSHNAYHIATNDYSISRCFPFGTKMLLWFFWLDIRQNDSFLATDNLLPNLVCEEQTSKFYDISHRALNRKNCTELHQSNEFNSANVCTRSCIKVSARYIIWIQFLSIRHSWSKVQIDYLTAPTKYYSLCKDIITKSEYMIYRIFLRVPAYLRCRTDWSKSVFYVLLPFWWF